MTTHSSQRTRQYPETDNHSLWKEDEPQKERDHLPTTKAPLVSGRPKARKRIKMHSYTPEKFIRNLNITQLKSRKESSERTRNTSMTLAASKAVIFFSFLKMSSFWYLFWINPPLKLTYPPRKWDFPKGKDRLPTTNHPFSRALGVSFREGILPSNLEASGVQAQQARLGLSQGYTATWEP